MIKCLWEALGIDLTLYLAKGDNRLEFPCHRVVLLSHSPYFKGLLGGGFKESGQTEVLYPTLPP